MRVGTLMAEPIGSRESYLSERISVWRGDHVEWQVANRLPLSFVTVR